jgi:hypothetical protein
MRSFTPTKVNGLYMEHFVADAKNAITNSPEIALKGIQR